MNDDKISATAEWNTESYDDFVRYELIGATDSFPDFEDPATIYTHFLPNQNVDFFHRKFNDPSTDSYLDPSPPLAGCKYYKLYVKIGNEYLTSKTTKFDSGRKGIRGLVFKGVLTAEENLFLSTNEGPWLYDLKSEEVKIKEVWPKFYEFNSGDTGQGLLLYGIDDFFNNFISFDPDNFTEVSSIGSSPPLNFGSDFITSINGFIFHKKTFPTNHIYIRDASDFSLIASEELPDDMAPYRPPIKLSETEYLIPSSQGSSPIFNLSEQGEIISIEYKNLPQEIIGKPLYISPDKSKIITTTDLTLTNTNFEILATRDIIPSAITFSHDSKSIYVGGIGKVTKLSAEDLSIIEEIELPDNLNVEQLISASDKLIVRHQWDYYTIIHTIHQ
ncbi:MAG: hypothetical protein AB8F74_09305 [Saprospiraceae bacterium]